MAVLLGRRTMIAAGPCMFLAASHGRSAAPRFTIDWQGGAKTPAIAAALDAQIAGIVALPIKPAIIAFFAGQRIAVDPVPGSMSRIGPDGVHFERRAVPAENPVLLHELLHRYHLLRLPDGYENRRVLEFYAAARAERRYPAEAYMMRNPIEFFAMTASTILFGRQARPPFSRARVARTSPRLHDWIVAEFGLQSGPSSRPG